MRFITLVLAFLFLVIFMSSCGMSNEDIGETVKNSMQQTFDSKQPFNEWNLVVSTVQVFEQGDNNYKGLASIIHEGEIHDVSVQITVDGDNVLWEAPAGSFMFVTQKELQRLLQ